LIKLVEVVEEEEAFVTALDEAGLGEAERDPLGGISLQIEWGCESE